ncbi:DHA2 family efflux MFS transporter permease subunit [Periweissella beninensis]|uniref:DHA2 family efflux MFS transporter permease subunit n=1 Tax=Periweissella beninensis TaxID=504936 RepID=A0ABT0VJR5_9LACO|nr:DHA2 family efflux MFS transporter permease subunit [Periweissella beninensis]MBM7543933.1 EmrB/QacA subfamily drug resistance transporter [Periweissella beninensis]MCM2437659.1 DHA2 family efflux MFS transporter permease subunit [Periweissella beninensis]MCT4396147.1 DHA2 family efflux MFS transporter permease subunit [Periweissella beninensis]
MIDTQGKPFNRGLLIAVLLTGTFVTVLNQTVLATALPTLMKSLHESLGTVQWLTTGFMLVNGILIPISAWLSHRFNTKWLYLGSMLIFLIGTVIAFTADSFSQLLIGRLTQAVAVGVTMPLLQVIMLSIFPANNRGAAMGMAGLVIGLAPALGPTLSGWILDNYKWQMLFGIMIPIILIVLVAGFFFMRPVIATKKEKLDYFSVILSTIGFGSLLYGFSEVSSKGWGDINYVIVPLIIGLIFIVLFVYRQTKIEKPLLQVKVFKNVQFTVATILGALVMMTMIGAEMVIPQYLQTVRGMTPFHAGLTLLAGAFMMGIMSPITGRIYDQMGAKRLVIAGLVILTAGSLPFTALTETTPIVTVTVLYAIRMFGISMVMMPVTTAGMSALTGEMVAHGTAVNNTTRQVAASMGTAIMISVLSNVINNNMPSKHLLTTTPLEYKNQALNAAIDGYHAAFWVAIGFAIIGLGVSFFLKAKRNKSQTLQSGGAK